MKTKIALFLSLIIFTLAATSIFAENVNNSMQKTTSSKINKGNYSAFCSHINKKISFSIEKYNATQKFEEDYKKLKNKTAQLTQQVEKAKKSKQAYIEALRIQQVQVCKSKEALSQSIKNITPIRNVYLKDVQEVNKLLK